MWSRLSPATATARAASPSARKGRQAEPCSLRRLPETARPQSLAEAELSVKLEGQNDDATALLALYGLPVLPLGMTGAAQTDFSLKGTLAGGLETSATMSGSDFSASFLGTAALNEEGIAAKGKVKLEAADIEPWLMTVGAGMPGMGMGMPVALEAEADYAEGLLVLAGLDGTVDEGAVAGDINVGIKDGKPHLTGQLTLDELDLDPLAQMVLGETAMEGGTEKWSDVPFQPKVAAPFSAEVGNHRGDAVGGTAAPPPTMPACRSALTVKA